MSVQSTRRTFIKASSLSAGALALGEIQLRGGLTTNKQRIEILHAPMSTRALEESTRCSAICQESGRSSRATRHRRGLTAYYALAAHLFKSGQRCCAYSSLIVA
jgi:hypothetical protein